MVFMETQHQIEITFQESKQGEKSPPERHSGMQRRVAEEEKGVKIHFDVSFLKHSSLRTTTIIVHTMCLCVLTELGQLLVCFKKRIQSGKGGFYTQS